MAKARSGRDSNSIMRAAAEGSEVEIAVIGFVVARFEPDEDPVAFVPRTAERDDFRVAKIFVERKASQSSFRRSIEPEKVERVR